MTRSFPPCSRSLGAALVLAVFVAACGGKSSSDQPHDGDHGSSGGVAGNSGGLSTTGGSDSSSGGVGGSEAGGGNSTSSGGSSGPYTSGGSNAGLTCGKVKCPPLPATCKKFVQDPNECCPTCLDSGCGECPPLLCESGTHSELVDGDCCPSCVEDPPDACARGRSEYANLRAQLLDKYSSVGCMNSADCTLILEDNSCAYACDAALPTSTSHDFTSNLENSARVGCSTCMLPERADCVLLLPACVNGQCVGVPPR